MSKSRASGRKLQIITDTLYESHQLDLLSFVNDHALADLSLKDKQVRTSLVKNSAAKTHLIHNHGEVDKNKNFLNFCVGKSNHFALDSIKQFLTNASHDFSLIYLFSSSGLGKTHLLHAVANELQFQKKSFYLSSPRLMSSITDHFNILKNYDFILIDDIEEIEGALDLQKIFCNLIDYSHTGKIKLIITGEKRLRDLGACQERFKGKLASGLVHQFFDLDEKLVAAIVQKKCENLNLILTNKVKDQVAKCLDFNVYGLEGLLYKLKNRVDIKNEEITLDLVVQEMRSMDKLYYQDDFKIFLKTVAYIFQISFEDLFSNMKRKDFSLARHVAMYILKEKMGLSIMRIAELFAKDHSSVIYGIARIKREIVNDNKIQIKVQKILEENNQYLTSF